MSNELKKYFTLTEEDPYYGRMTFRCIGLIDLEELASQKLTNVLLKQYHPLDFFRTVFQYGVKKSEKYDTDTAWAVMLTLDEDNADWKPEPHNGYSQFWLQNKKNNPFVVGAKEYQKAIQWQEGGQGLFTPSYLDNMKDVDDLVQHFKEKPDTPLTPFIY